MRKFFQKIPSPANKKWKILLFLASFLIGCLIFFLVIKNIGWPEIRKALVSFKLWQGLVILGFTASTILINTWKWKEVLKGLEVKLPFKKLWQSYLASFSVRYLVPIALVGSEIFQAQIIKEMNAIPWQKSIASVIIERILEITANLVVIFFGVVFFLLTIGLLPTGFEIILGGVLFLLTLLVTFFYLKSFRKESMAKAIGRLFNHRLDSKPLEIEQEIFNFFSPKKTAMWTSFLLAFLKTGITGIRNWLVIIFLGKSIGLAPVLSILGFAYLAGALPIPAAIGSQDAVQAFVFNSFGIGASNGTAFAIIIRSTEIIVALFGVAIFFRLSLGLLKNAILKKTEKLAEEMLNKNESS